MAQKLGQDEKRLWAVVHFVLFVIWAVFISGWFISIPEWTDEHYANLHNGALVRRIIGTIIFTIGVLGFTIRGRIADRFNNWRANNGAVKDAPWWQPVLLHASIIIIGVWLAVA